MKFAALGPAPATAVFVLRFDAFGDLRNSLTAAPISESGYYHVVEVFPAQGCGKNVNYSKQEVEKGCI